jgi:predicted membrane protein
MVMLVLILLLVLLQPIGVVFCAPIALLAFFLVPSVATQPRADHLNKIRDHLLSNLFWNVYFTFKKYTDFVLFQCILWTLGVMGTHYIKSKIKATKLAFGVSSSPSSSKPLVISSKGNLINRDHRTPKTALAAVEKGVEKTLKRRVIVCNHTSYFDILYLAHR